MLLQIKTSLKVMQTNSSSLTKKNAKSTEMRGRFVWFHTPRTKHTDRPSLSSSRRPCYLPWGTSPSRPIYVRSSAPPQESHPPRAIYYLSLFIIMVMIIRYEIALRRDFKRMNGKKKCHVICMNPCAMGGSWHRHGDSKKKETIRRYVSSRKASSWRSDPTWVMIYDYGGG